MNIKKGDNVLIISGKDRGRTAKVLEVFPAENKLIAEGINLRKRHIRPKKSGEKGQIVQLPAPLDVSNVKLVCSNCGKPTRVGYKISQSESGKKIKTRICKKCGKPA